MREQLLAAQIVLALWGLARAEVHQVIPYRVFPRKVLITNTGKQQLDQKLITRDEQPQQATFPDTKPRRVYNQAAPTPKMSFTQFASNSSNAAPKYELVLARLNEDIGWITQIPSYWKVTVYNKGGPGQELREVPDRTFKVIDISNHGREGETYMHHIVLRWETLAEYTVFGQAWPFVHSQHFVELLNHPQILGNVQCMSLVYTETGHPDNITPKEVVEAYRKHPWYRAERLSLRTLDSIYFTDIGATNIARRYLVMHNLPPGTNIIAHHFEVIGLKGWVPYEQEVGSFAYGGQFGVHRDKILQHPRHVYENLMASLIASDLHAWIAERMYLMLFSGPHYVDT